jgi:hypothetical protein
MEEIFKHPFMPTFIVSVLSLWPFMRLYKRVGLPQGYAFLLFASHLVPFLGLLLAITPLAIKQWPNFPKAPAPEKPVKVAI